MDCPHNQSAKQIRPVADLVLDGVDEGVTVGVADAVPVLGGVNVGVGEAVADALWLSDGVSENIHTIGAWEAAMPFQGVEQHHRWADDHILSLQ